MEFIHKEFCDVNAGSRVRVDLDTAANVCLMDDYNFRKFRSGQEHRYIGGLARRTPVLLTVPQYGNWHVTIDLGGASGTVRHSISILRA